MKSGFINIIGKPNAGKSTLMNAFVGERLSIITRKPQTTRHRIIGLVSGDDFQMVFSDTPGIVEQPRYRMHNAMNRFVREAFEDADILIFLVDTTEPVDSNLSLLPKIQRLECPKILVMNKLDLVEENVLDEKEAAWKELGGFSETYRISALHKDNVDKLFARLQELLPEGPEYYPKDQLTDKPERFFVSEIVREKVLMFYRDEIPYSVEVAVEAFQEDEEKPLIRIRAILFAMRESQKNILIGPGGRDIKRVGMEARKDLEVFLEKKVYLELFVKVRDNWRDSDKHLKNFGYE